MPLTSWDFDPAYRKPLHVVAENVFAIRDDGEFRTLISVRGHMHSCVEDLPTIWRYLHDAETHSSVALQLQKS